MQAIILAGGKGTRLQSVVNEVPKPMAPIAGKPFIDYLIQNLKRKGFTKFYLSINYKKDIIIDYFNTDPSIVFIEEHDFLGTGGAIKHVFNCINPADPIFVINGDTYIDFEPKNMLSASGDITMLLSKCDNCFRYGKISIESDRVIAFQEKGDATNGLINAGIYLVPPNLFKTTSTTDSFSFEEYLASHLTSLYLTYVVSDSFFIDIGIPEDYEIAKEYFNSDCISS